MTSTRILMPLLHKKVTTFKGPTWYFDQGVFLDTIYDEDFGALYRHDLNDYYKSNINIQSTCIYIDDPSFNDFHSFCKDMATKLKFVLNNFSTGAPVVLPFSVLLGTSGKGRVLKIADIEPVTNLHMLKQQTYKIKSSSDRATVSNYYKVISNCCINNPSILFALDRFNSCLTRHNIFDKIVDITISLESLISGTQELRYKFALHNSFIAEDNTNSRIEAFNLFLSLYDARSGIVHGDTDSRDKKKAFTEIETNWDKIVRFARSALNYYLIFLHTHNKTEWDQHLKRLVFGADKRIVD